MKKIDKICPICNIIFSVPFSHQDRYKTCGHKCGGILRQKPIVTNICKICKIEFVSKKHPKRPAEYCSKACCGKKGSLTNTIKICLECEIKFKVIASQKERKQFCSRKCQLSKWNRDSEEKQTPGMYKINAWRKYERKCYDCGLDDKRLLVIHHIDGDRKNGKIENLIPVCHNCHCLRHIKMSGNNRLPSYRGAD